MLDNGESSALLLDSVGGNHITATLGQALDFDGVADGIYTDDDLMDFVHGGTKLAMYAIFRQPSTVTNTGGILLAGGRTTVNACMRLYTPLTRKLRVYVRTAAGTIIYDTNTSAYSNDVWTGVIFVLDVSGTPTGQFYFKNYTTDGAWTAATATRVDAVSTTGTTISLETAANWRRFTLGAGFTDTSISYPSDLMIHSGGIGAFYDYTEAVNILARAGSSSDHFLVTLDDGASLTTACVTGSETCTAITGVSIDATSWLNGAHQPSIPQKGFGGGAYTGGVGVKCLVDLGDTDDTTPCGGKSLSEIASPGLNFTFECWVYKPAADCDASSVWWSIFDQTSVETGPYLRTGTTTNQLVHEVYVNGTSRTATVTANASGWWYVACVYRAGDTEIHVAQPGASSLTSNNSGTTMGEVTEITGATDHKMTIFGRVGTTLGNYLNRADDGARIEDLVYHAGAALTKEQLLERFNYSKARYL